MGGAGCYGPIFSLSGQMAVKCRIRFDEVISLHPECKDDYEFLNGRYNRPEYRLSFKPLEGDIIVFDNWQLLHARDEVFGYPEREHRRMWISRLQPEFQADVKLGIRPISLETLLAIDKNNKPGI
jgi:hypothetical protein